LEREEIKFRFWRLAGRVQEAETKKPPLTEAINDREEQEATFVLPEI
jgi:hypothetical protein